MVRVIPHSYIISLVPMVGKTLLMTSSSKTLDLLNRVSFSRFILSGLNAFCLEQESRNENFLTNIRDYEISVSLSIGKRDTDRVGN